MLTIKKIRNATQSGGRGVDNTRTPARYGAFDGETLCLSIVANAVRPYVSPEWHIYDVKRDYIRIKTCRTLGEAREWIARRY